MTDITTALETVQRFVRRVAADPLDLDDKLGALAALSTIEAELGDLKTALEEERIERDEAVAALRDAKRLLGYYVQYATADPVGWRTGARGETVEQTRRLLARLSTPKEPTEAIYVCADPRHAARLSTPKEPETP